MIYHYDLGWFYENSESDGDWYWADKLDMDEKDLSTFSDNFDDWMFFDSENSNAYNFKSKV